jgi:acetyl-CoA carboxylase carboxyltransferase component
MSSKMMGAAYVLAWSTAQIASVSSDTAASMIFRKEMAQAADSKQAQADRIHEYVEWFLNPYYAASRQDIDDVIHPTDTRKRVIQVLEATLEKKVERPWRKHSNIPI